MVIVLISGPPCAGKNHHVAVHRGPLDLVLDQDVLGPQGYRTALEGLHRAAAPRAWVIRCLPGPSRRAAFAEQIGAHEVVHLQPATPVLMERARRRPQPHRHVAAVRAWLAAEAVDEALTSADPSPAVRPWW